MKLNTLKDLESIIKLCRKHGIEDLSVPTEQGSLVIKLGAPPQIIEKTSNNSVAYTPGGITEDSQIVSDMLTPEQLLMWSITGDNQ